MRLKHPLFSFGTYLADTACAGCYRRR